MFLLALIGIYHINPINFEEGDEVEVEKEMNLDEVEGRKIQRHFDLFKRNRLTSQMSRRVEKSAEIYNFHPTINPQSEMMADRHRNMMLEEANNLISDYP